MNNRVTRWIDRGMLELTEDCWHWRGAQTTDGYPVVSYEGNTNCRGHRVMYKLYNPEEDISDKVIRHMCDNPMCMNPEHLLSGSPTQNMEDRQDRRRTHNQVHQLEILAVRDLHNLGYKRKRIAMVTRIGIRRVEYILKKYIQA